MKYKLKKIISFFIILVLFSNSTMAEQVGCGNKNGEKRFRCQIKNVCDAYKPENFVFKTKDYFKEIGNSANPLEKAKKLYRENQNSIYTCALINIQKNSFKIIKEKLSKIDKTGELKSIIDKKIELKLNKIKLLEKQKKCISPEHQEKQENSLTQKQEILKESAYELCKYNYYLNYLKNYYKNLDKMDNNVMQKTKAKKYKVDELAKIYNGIQNNIKSEEDHSYQVFKIAFETYIDYEDFFPVHILLEIIQEDFRILRRKFHQAISPINQVVYKISNAMSIH